MQVNNTTGYRRHILGSPILLKMPSRVEKVFFSKNTLHKFSNFSKFGISQLFSKNPSIQVEKTIQKIIFSYTLCNKFAIFHRYWKKNQFFQKKLLNVFDKSCYCSRILRQMCYNLLITKRKFRIVWTIIRFGQFQWQITLKKNARACVEGMIFHPYCKHGRKRTKKQTEQKTDGSNSKKLFHKYPIKLQKVMQYQMPNWNIIEMEISKQI